MGIRLYWGQRKKVQGRVPGEEEKVALEMGFTGHIGI